MNDEDDFQEWKKYLIKSVDRLIIQHDALNTNLQNIKIEIATLKTKASIWGGIAGFIPTAVFWIMELIKLKK